MHTGIGLFPVLGLLSAGVVALYVVAYPLAKLWDAPALVAVSASAALACMAYGRIIVSRAYLVFAGFSLAILLVSLWGKMPAAWTVYRDDFAAIRQWVWVPLLPLVTTAFVLLFRQVRDGINAAPLVWVVGLAVAVFAVRIWILGPGSAESSGIYTLTGNNAVILMAFAFWLFRRNGQALVSLIGLAALALVSNSAQSQLLALCLLLIWLTRGHFLVLAGLLVAVFALLIVAPFVAYPLHEIDNNTGMRALFWRDTLEALGQTYGLGVGYGTEYVRNDFTELKHAYWFLADETAAGRLHISTHSTLYDLALRNGLVGLVLFLVWFAGQLSRRGVAQADRGLFASMAAIVVVSCLVNPGLTAINFLFASAMGLAVMVIIRREGWYGVSRAEPRA